MGVAQAMHLVSGICPLCSKSAILIQVLVISGSGLWSGPPHILLLVQPSVSVRSAFSCNRNPYCSGLNKQGTVLTQQKVQGESNKSLHSCSKVSSENQAPSMFLLYILGIKPSSSSLQDGCCISRHHILFQDRKKKKEYRAKEHDFSSVKQQPFLRLLNSTQQTCKLYPLATCNTVTWSPLVPGEPVSLHFWLNTSMPWAKNKVLLAKN